MQHLLKHQQREIKICDVKEVNLQKSNFPINMKMV